MIYVVKMTYMYQMCFSGRPDPAPDGLFGRRRPRLAPETLETPQARRAAAESAPRPLTPGELILVARAWRRRADESSGRVAEALESVAALRAPPPLETTTFPSPPPKSVVRKISEFMGL